MHRKLELRPRTAALCLAALLAGSSATAGAATLFINELHYDNDGTDVDEGVEVAGPAGTALAGWELVFYNGSDAEPYKTVALPDVILPDLGGGFGVAAVPVSGIQNGPDAVALVDPQGGVDRLLSYEGSFTAVGGPADGQLSVDLGVAEARSQALGLSLGLTGLGAAAADFVWSGPLAASFGAVNPGQTFASPVPVPTAGLLLLSVAPVLAAVGRRRQAR